MKWCCRGQIKNQRRAKYRMTHAIREHGKGQTAHQFDKLIEFDGVVRKKK
jgi:hypothetical protein